MFEFFPGNRRWSITTIRLIGKAYQGGSEFNECCKAINGLKEASGVDQWYVEWMKLAKDIETWGESALRSGHRETARNALLRSSMYYFTARILLNDDPRILEAHKRSVDCFGRAGELFNPPLERVSIPFESMQMKGYFFPAMGDKPGPGMIFVIGADTTPEEAYFFGINEARARGISCLVFNGPGQAGSLIEDGIPSRPDYEKPIAAGLDYLATRKEVDPKRLGLIGHSMGGYYAARGAAYDDRVKACVIWGACFDVLKDYFEFHPPSKARCMWLVGAKSEAETRERLKSFNLNEAAKKIRCPILILHGEEDDIVSPDAARRLYCETICAKELKMFSAAEGGSWHCQHDLPTVAQAYVYDWLRGALCSTGAYRARSKSSAEDGPSTGRDSGDLE